MTEMLWDDTRYDSPPDPDEHSPMDFLGILALACVLLMMVAWLATQNGVW